MLGGQVEQQVCLARPRTPEPNVDMTMGASLPVGGGGTSEEEDYDFTRDDPVRMPTITQSESEQSD